MKQPEEYGYEFLSVTDASFPAKLPEKYPAVGANATEQVTSAASLPYEVVLDQDLRHYLLRKGQHVLGVSSASKINSSAAEVMAPGTSDDWAHSSRSNYEMWAVTTSEVDRPMETAISETVDTCRAAAKVSSYPLSTVFSCNQNVSGHNAHIQSAPYTVSRRLPKDVLKQFGSIEIPITHEAKPKGKTTDKVLDTSVRLKKVPAKTNLSKKPKKRMRDKKALLRSENLLETTSDDRMLKSKRTAEQPKIISQSLHRASGGHVTGEARGRLETCVTEENDEAILENFHELLSVLSSSACQSEMSFRPVSPRVDTGAQIPQKIVRSRLIQKDFPQQHPGCRVPEQEKQRYIPPNIIGSKRVPKITPRAKEGTKITEEVGMTVEKDEVRDKSPVHVTVDDETPVHVHVKKPVAKKPKSSSHTNAEVKQVRKAATNSKRNASPHTKERWVPPPGRTSHSSSKVIFQNTGEEPEHDGAGNDTEEEDRTVRKMRHYEKRIDELMNEVGSLKAQADNQTTRGRQALRSRPKSTEGRASPKSKSHYGNYRESSASPLRPYSPTLGFPLSDLATQRALLEKEDELLDTRRELMHSDRERSWLRRSMEHLQDEAITSNRGVYEEKVQLYLQCLQETEQLAQERDQLMRKLIQVEMDGQAAASQLGMLRDTIRRLREENILSKSDRELLQQQKEVLMDRLGDFEHTNRSLRQMLRERHEQESNELRMQEQRGALLDRLAQTEDRLQSVRTEVMEKDREILKLQSMVDGQRQENMTFAGVQTSLETTRAHLQKQLRQKEGDCNRMAVQIRSLESQLAQERIEVDHLQTLLAKAKEKATQDKEALKKATRVQKTRAVRSEDAMEGLQAQVLERDSLLTELREEMNDIKSHCEKLHKEKSQLIGERSALKTRVSELESAVMRVEDSAKESMDTSKSQFFEKEAEAHRLALENEQLRGTLRKSDGQLKESDAEIAQLRKSIRQYEGLIEEYRAQMNRSRREADETLIQLDEQKKELNKVQREGELELEKVRTRLQTRLQELEPIPELMRVTELKLQDATEQLVQLEQTNSENSQIINELTHQLSKTATELDDTNDQLKEKSETSRQLEARLEAMLKRLRDMDEQNKDLMTKLSQRDEAVHQVNMRLDESSRENASLARQLEELLAGARRHSETTREKSTAKERTWHMRVNDLEQQLILARTEMARLKREKEEAERKCNSRLYDLKDRLEQSHSTNRSLQNYIQFLKNSYANVFGDAPLPAASTSRGATSLF